LPSEHAFGDGAASELGSATQIGQVQSLVSEVVQRETPLQYQLRHLGLQLAMAAGTVCRTILTSGTSPKGSTREDLAHGLRRGRAERALPWVTGSVA